MAILEAHQRPFCLHTALCVAFPVSPMQYADIHLHEQLMNRLITSTEHMLRAFLAARGTSQKNLAGQGHGKMALKGKCVQLQV